MLEGEMMNQRCETIRWMLGGFLLAVVLSLPSTGKAEALCASVKIEIQQDLTLERDGFDASMKIVNGFEGVALSNVNITVLFTDADGVSVSATTNAASTNELFFYRVSSLNGINGTMNGVVAGGEEAEIHWLIIPNPGAGGSNEVGQFYYVGATLSYTVGGEVKTVEVEPDSILVKPMPQLALDYFLPREVYGDDANTPAVVEPSIPFPVGLRIKNIGYGTAKNVRIDSGQPEIVDNQLGLLVSFAIRASEVNGLGVSKSLLLNFGNIDKSESSMGRWIMTVALSGTFRDFEADVTHADELGGQLTSFILQTNVQTHMHVSDVLVDLNGRDTVRDFLGTNMVVYESQGIDSPVSDMSEFSSLTGGGAQYTLSISSATQGFIYVKETNTASESLVLKEVTRSDGKKINPANTWLSKTRKNEQQWDHFFNLFDVDASNFTYAVVFQSTADANQAPLLSYIGPKIVHAGHAIGFGICATNDDGAPALTTGSLPVDADFMAYTNGTGFFSWTPTTDQVGQYQIKFTASDGELSDSETIALTVKSGAPPAYPSWWTLRGVLATNEQVITNDWAPVNAGQVKHIAGMAWDELEALPGGAGFNLGFVNSNNYVAINLGQLKHLATNFYDRLSMGYPWVGAANTNDFAIANIGQVKNLFSFDPGRDSDADGLPDWWESQYGGSDTSMDPVADPDGDGKPNLYEYLFKEIP